MFMPREDPVDPVFGQKIIVRLIAVKRARELPAESAEIAVLILRDSVFPQLRDVFLIFCHDGRRDK